MYIVTQLSLSYPTPYPRRYLCRWTTTGIRISCKTSCKISDSLSCNDLIHGLIFVQSLVGKNFIPSWGYFQALYGWKLKSVLFARLDNSRCCSKSRFLPCLAVLLPQCYIISKHKALYSDAIEVAKLGPKFNDFWPN